MTPPSSTAAMAFVSLSFYSTTPTACAFSSPPRSFLKSNPNDKNDYIARVITTAPSTFTFTTVSSPPTPPCLSMSSSEGGGGGGGSADASGRKRRKRKDGKNLASIRAERKGDDDDDGGVAIPTPVETTETTAAPTTAAAAAAPVELKVMDVRDIVSGATAPSTIGRTTEEDEEEDDEYEYYDDDEEDYDDDEYEETDEYEYYFTDEDGREVVVDDSFGTSLAGGGTGLLADARKLRETQSPSSPTASEGGGDGTTGGGLKEAGIDALSKIVTADFFLVVALLLWFLVGVFCSKVLGNDGVYLQFAGLFEPVVQPALGILILGALLTGVLKEKEVEDE